MKRLRIETVLLVGLSFFVPGLSHADERREPFEFTRMVAHWSEYGDPEYLSFIDEAQPELVQLGFYGGHFWSLAHTPQYKGYPAHFPVQGLRECADWFADKNRELRKRNVKVIGHFNVEFLVGDPDGPEGPRGFFKFYRDLWDVELLGPKPVDDPLEMMEKNPDGSPIVQDGYSIGGMKEYWACLRNPHWQVVLKAWVKRGVELGVDGFIANYFYRHNCHCEHCQKGFRQYMAERFTAPDLKERFAIQDIESHKFDELVYWHKPEESTPLRREMLRWSQISNKQVFDEVFVRYGRSLKPDLLVAQWNHLGNFSQIGGDERCLLPGEMWSADEDYLWYSAGDSAHYSDLANGFLGDVTLQARYIRGASGGKPFTIGKYEGTRIRSAIAELAANGGAPMGFYARFTDPEARQVFARYYQFLRRFDDLYRADRSHAEAVLLYPRSAVHDGRLDEVTAFRELGKSLLEHHVLFDVLPDDVATKERLAAYPTVLRCDQSDDLLPKSRSRFDAPKTVRVSANRSAQGNVLTVHFVNYNREEPPKGNDNQPSAGRGIQDEKPIAAPSIRADVVIPDGRQVKSVDALSPEYADPKPIEFQTHGDRIEFTVPEFLVYSVVRITLE